MRGLLLALLLLVACGGTSSTTVVSSAPSASAAPLPDGVARLVESVRRQTARVERIDRVEAVRVKWRDVERGSAIAVPGTDPDEDVWVVVALGSFGPPSILDTGSDPCAYWVSTASGDVRTYRQGALTACEPFMPGGIPLPSPAAVRCGPLPQGYSVFDRYQFSPTAAGPLLFETGRDDAWRMPALVPGRFLFEAGDGGGTYYSTYCRRTWALAVPGPEEDMLRLGLGAPNASGRPGKAHLWMKDLHALRMIASADGIVSVIVEPRAGLEVASFDWRALAPRGGYVRFEFRDASGTELAPYDVANGP